MKVIGMTVKDHVPRVTALVAVVFIVQRLVHVADEMNHEFKGREFSPRWDAFGGCRKGGA
jgi:hypothetical protein